MPGRRHTVSRASLQPATNTPPTTSNNRLSKAQRILGTDNDLNIDSPVYDTGGDYSWRNVGSRSSDMSISISESTQSTNENESIHESESEQWDRESGVFPNAQRLHGKASSTLLGQHLNEERPIDPSGAAASLRHNDSSSTLKSYYDRQKSPLAISQQTSASSARDLALRKGFPPVLQRSPLLNVESIDRFEDDFAENCVYTKEEEELVPQKMKKKPARLDLSMLFPRSRKHGDKSPAASPSSMSTNNSLMSIPQPESTRRRLKKTASKESMQSQKNSIRTTRSQDSQARQMNTASHNLYDHLPVRVPHMDQIPEASVPERIASRARRDDHGHSNPNASSEYLSTSDRDREHPDHSPFSWKNVRSSMMVSPYDNSSAASISSRNTKTSRAASIMSHSDLKDKSVLSLSSESEGESSDADIRSVVSPNPSSKFDRMIQQAPERSSLRQSDTQRRSANPHGGLTPWAQGQRRSTTKERSSLLQIPKTTPHGSRSSGVAWQPSQAENYAPHPQKESHMSVQKEKRAPRHHPSSIKSGRSLQQPTPPLSPSSVEFRQNPERESRFMAVTKQEEALLEALRMKRARMREEIIEEHETKKTPSPPRIPERSASRYSTTSTTNTIRSSTAPGKQRVLLFLDTPLAESHGIDTSEPSPDLSDFLSFGSDENSTPRNSWAPPRNGNGKARPDSFASPYPRADRFWPATPPSAARLSAVGVAGVMGKKRLATEKVRFVDEGKVNHQDYYLEETHTGVIWGM